MICIFGHKWNGCTCTRCGKKRDQDHDFQPVAGKCREECTRCKATRPIEHNYQPVEGKCLEKCSRCGATRMLAHNFKRVKGRCVEKCTRCGEEREAHNYDDLGFCRRCDAVHPQPFSLKDLSPDQKRSLINAVKILQKANQAPSLNAAFDATLSQLESRELRLGLVELGVAMVACLKIRPALIEGLDGMLKNNPQEGYARLLMATSLNAVAEKINTLLDNFNKETTRRSVAKYADDLKAVFNHYMGMVAYEGDAWEEAIREPIDRLVAGGSEALSALKHALLSCADGKGADLSGQWWYGSVYAVRILAKFPADAAQEAMLELLEKDSKVAEWFWYVQKEVMEVLPEIATAKAYARLKKLAASPFSMGPNEKIEELRDRLKEQVEKSISYQPFTGQGLCDVCNQSLHDKKAWIVPNNVFYNSPLYREYYKQFQKNLTGLDINDNVFEEMLQNDKSKGSAVCSDCIYMFIK